MSTTQTKTSTRTKAIAAVAVVAALGLIGYAAAIVGSTSIKSDLTTAISYSSFSSSVAYGDSQTYAIGVQNSGVAKASNFIVRLTSDVDLHSVTTTSPYTTCILTFDGAKCTIAELAGSGGSMGFNVEVRNYSETTAECNTSKSVNLVSAVDVTSVVSEKSESNNTATKTITLAGPTGTDCIDLSAYTNTYYNAVANTILPLDRGEVPVASGEEFSLGGYEFGVTNESTSDVEGEFYLTYDLPEELEVVGYSSVNYECYADEDTAPRQVICSTKDTYTTFNAGFSYGVVDVIMKNVATKTQIPCGTTKEVELTGTVDSDDTITESVENNNTDTATIELSSPC